MCFDLNSEGDGPEKGSLFEIRLSMQKKENSFCEQGMTQRSVGTKNYTNLFLCGPNPPGRFSGNSSPDLSRRRNWQKVKVCINIKAEIHKDFTILMQLLSVWQQPRSDPRYFFWILVF